MEGRRIAIRGTVQGVGFRPWIYRLACDEGVTGSVKNGPRGVTIDAFAKERVLDELLDRIARELPSAAHIDELSWEPLAADAPDSFSILESDHGGQRRANIPPELATCDDCLRELFDPNDRRYRYPFINCTSCGPRYTIVREVPYDRASTSMARFPLCRECRREYEDPRDRRFHAEPNACPKCGPRLSFEGEDGAGDPLLAAARAIAAGKIAAIKGLGGFHLACDATCDEAVRALRARKHREEKPLAIMVRNLEAARALAIVGPIEEKILTSSERPIVLLDRRDAGSISALVAPGTPRIGVMLPYTPLHHLLLAELDRPLVMTSGNASDEPIARDDDDAERRLSGIADCFLTHDRDVENRADDSIVSVIAGHPVILRRARGFVPRAVLLERPVKEPILAAGALLKNTVCIAVGESAYLGPHTGDLENLETYESFQENIDRLERLLGVHPKIVAHDLHPDYLSTKYARERGAAALIGVQHHHAHVASAIAEHHLLGPVYGVAYDGTGFGTDGTAWGGELLRADAESFERIATFRPIALAGGDRAVREVWRIAVALLEDAFDGGPPPELLRFPRCNVGGVRQLLRSRAASPLARGVGRYFDGIGALVLAKTHARFEGQAAMALEHAAHASEHGLYHWAVDWHAAPWEIDLRPLVREVAEDLSSGAPPGKIAAKFHNTIVEATAVVLREALLRHGALPVVLTGGCFANARLMGGLVEELAGECEVHVHRDVPPGDGGIALGQAIVADAVRRRS